MVKKTENEHMAENSIHRAMRMGNLGFRVAGSYLGYQVQNMFLDSDTREQKKKLLHQKNAKRVREEMQSLRGPIMKLGQVLSMQGHAIPNEVIKELTELQMNAPPMHTTLMRTQFKNSFGKYPEEIFSTFDMKPFAAASLGQVHRAVTLEGEDVVVKIQYPAIRKAIENDFSLLRTFSFPARVVKYMPEEMLSEIEEGILAETDYDREARNIMYFYENFKDIDYAFVPKVLPKYCTDKVLTMTRIEGKPLDRLLQEKRGQRWRNLVGYRLMKLFDHQVYGMGAIHADPHPGNYLYTEDGSIGLVDFGCVKYLPKDVLENCLDIRLRRWGGDKKKYDELMKRIWGDNIKFKNAKHRKVMDDLVKFYELVFPRNNEIVDFGEKKLLNRSFELWNQVLKYRLAIPEYLFLCRMELGMYNILYKLDAKVNTTELSEDLTN